MLAWLRRFTRDNNEATGANNSPSKRPDALDRRRPVKLECPVCGGDERHLCMRCRNAEPPKGPGLRGGW